MFNQNPNNYFQNTVTPSNENLGSDNYFGRDLQVPYMSNVNNDFMPNNMMQNQSYPPLQASTATPALNVAGYAQGGAVTPAKRKSKPKEAPYKVLAEMIQAQGKGEDTILAHINPLEAMMLKSMGGSGTINPKTGLPQFGFFKNPAKWLKSIVGPVGGAVLGNILLPGLGGVVGGALGGAAGSAARGRKDGAQAALRGLGIGAALPSAASLVGSGLTSLGAKGAGGGLSQYGNTNAIMPALDKLLGFGGSAGLPITSSAGALSSSPSNISAPAGSVGNAAGAAASGDFMGSLMSKSKDFLTDPKNLLSLASVGMQIANRPKEKSPEKQAEEQKRMQRALHLTPAELQAQEAQLLANEQMKRRVARNKFLPEERLGNIDPIYVRSNTPEEYSKQKKWLNYYNNPDFTGEPLRFAKGGSPFLEMLMMPDMEDNQASGYIEGNGLGQADNRRRAVRPKTYFIDATTVSNLGDGNSRAGANRIDALVSDGEYEISPEKVAKVGKGSPERGIALLDKLVKNVRKHKNGSAKLPPKAKSLTAYMRG